MALGLAISSSRSDALMLARLPEMDALRARAEELDEAHDAGALHELAITMAAARPALNEADVTGLRKHYARALELSRGRRASLYVAWAESAAIRTQDRAEFIAMLRSAVAVDPEAEPSLRLANTVARRRASWLLGRVDEYFLEPAPDAPKEGGR